MRNLLLTLLSLTCILLYFSCDQGEVCQDATETYAYTGFHIKINGTWRDTTFETIAIRGLQTPDTIAIDTVHNSQSVRLPLPQGSDSCKFIFSFAVYDSILNQNIDTTLIWLDIDTIITDIIVIDTTVIDTMIIDTTNEMVWDLKHYLTDTIRLNFTRQMYLVSPDCGFSHIFNLEKLGNTNNIIQSTEILNSEIGNFNEENIRILF